MTTTIPCVCEAQRVCVLHRRRLRYLHLVRGNSVRSTEGLTGTLPCRKTGSIATTWLKHSPHEAEGSFVNERVNMTALVLLSAPYFQNKSALCLKIRVSGAVKLNIGFIDSRRFQTTHCSDIHGTVTNNPGILNHLRRRRFLRNAGNQ